MKKIIVLILIIFSVDASLAQDDADIAKVYVKRAEASYNNLRYDNSLEYFDKALKYMDSITDNKVANLGMRIHFELEDFKKARRYSKKFFALTKDKNSDLYLENLDLFVTITERIEEQEEYEKKLEEKRLLKEKELARIDSLKSIWVEKSNKLSIKADTIFAFNKNNVAVYKSDTDFGILNDKGIVLIEPKRFKKALNFDGFVLLANKTENPTKILVYNTNTKEKTLLSVTELNASASHFTNIMLPRANGKLVFYPDNSLTTLIFDVNENKVTSVENKKELFKALKKFKIIENYNKNNQLKINKIYYNFGGHLGGGIYTLYNNDFSVHGYLFSRSKKVLLKKEYGFLGAFDENTNTIQSQNDNETIWLNKNGDRVDAPINSFSNYEGISKVNKLANGNYQINRDGIIVLGEKKLISLVDFIKENSPNNSPDNSPKGNPEDSPKR